MDRTCLHTSLGHKRLSSLRSRTPSATARWLWHRLLLCSPLDMLPQRGSHCPGFSLSRATYVVSGARLLSAVCTPGEGKNPYQPAGRTLRTLSARGSREKETCPGSVPLRRAGARRRADMASSVWQSGAWTAGVLTVGAGPAPTEGKARAVSRA